MLLTVSAAMVEELPAAASSAAAFAAVSPRMPCGQKAVRGQGGGEVKGAIVGADSERWALKNTLHGH